MKPERVVAAATGRPVGVDRPDLPAIFAARSAPIRRALDEIRRLARSAAVPVVLEGESGTGKTIIARWIHDSSPRARAPFQAVVLSALEETLAGAALFGHIAGAFTDARYARAGAFVSASGGTVFLDEIGKAPKGIQQKLLHVVETGEIQPLGPDRVVKGSVRIVAASNVPLHRLVDEGPSLPTRFARLQAFSVG